MQGEIDKSKKPVKFNLIGDNEVFNTAVFKTPQIEIIGNEVIEINGCEGIYEYTADYIKLRIKNGALVVCGNDFKILTFENKLITIKGKIVSIEFCI